jgi:hypothetical protein
VAVVGSIAEHTLAKLSKTEQHRAHLSNTAGAMPSPTVRHGTVAYRLCSHCQLLAVHHGAHVTYCLGQVRA